MSTTLQLRAAGRLLLLLATLGGGSTYAAAEAAKLTPHLAPTGLAADAPTLADLAEQRREIQTRLARVAERLAQSPGEQARPSLVRELELLKWIDLIYSNYETTSQQFDELQQEARHVDQELRESELTDQQLSFIQLDELQDLVILEQSRQESLQLEIEAARAALDDAHRSKKEADSRRRLVREAAEAGHDSEKRADAAREIALLQLTGRAYGLVVEQLQLEVKIKTLQHQLSGKRAESIQQQVTRWQGKAAFSEADLATKIEQIDLVEARYVQLTEETQQALQDADHRWEEAKRAVRGLAEADPVLNEQLAAWSQARELRQEQLSYMKQALVYAGQIRNVWRRRFELINHEAPRPDYVAWADELAVQQEELHRFQRLISIRTDEHMGDAATVRRRLYDLQERQGELSQWVQLQVDELNNTIEQYTSLQVVLKSAERLLQRFSSELAREIQPTSLRQALSRAAQVLLTAWNYEITSVDDRPITVRKVVVGVLLFMAGFVTARMLSRGLGRRMLPRLGLTEGASQAFQSIAFYLMLTCFGILSLDMINIPLTVFAFMGGAIAIGVGFGSQNILNNFISGLIVLAERPIRVGDLVEISGLTGTIEHIGARSTRIKTGSNLEIIVPNSSFLENNVTNWTLSDTRTRTMVSVGVAYGSPTDEVARLLRRAVVEHAEVLRTPEPIVLFKDFGDNSLLFEIHFWVHMQTMMQAQRIASDIRHKIDRLFSEADISIAFPQRDVHLDAIAPIEVRLRHDVQETHLHTPRSGAA